MMTEQQLKDEIHGIRQQLNNTPMTMLHTIRALESKLKALKGVWEYDQ